MEIQAHRYNNAILRVGKARRNFVFRSCIEPLDPWRINPCSKADNVRCGYRGFQLMSYILGRIWVTYSSSSTFKTLYKPIVVCCEDESYSPTVLRQRFSDPLPCGLNVEYVWDKAWGDFHLQKTYNLNMKKELCHSLGLMMLRLVAHFRMKQN